MRNIFAIISTLSLSLSFLVVFSTFARPPTSFVAAEEGHILFIIQLEQASLASYQGGHPEFRGTSNFVTGANKLDVRSPKSLAYLDYLEKAQDTMITKINQRLGRKVTIPFKYLYVLNAIAIEISHSETAIVMKLPGVKNVWVDKNRALETDTGPAWIGAPDIWEGNNTKGIETLGEGVILGILDTGVNHDHPSFAEVGPVDGYVHQNPYGDGVFAGICDPNHPNHQPDFCNNKLIGAYAFHPDTTDPEDRHGHGSHTMSIAGGNMVDAALVAPTASLQAAISGVAPHANLIAYLVCYNGLCPMTSSVAAINQGIADGVDIFSFSIEGADNPWNDPVSLAFLEAFGAGAYVSAAAGNNGPEAGLVANTGGWNATVGAATHNRLVSKTLHDLSGGATTPPGSLYGTSLSSGYGPAPIVRARDFGDTKCENPFSPNTWTNGEIVVCDRGSNLLTEMGENVLAGGAGGLVLANKNSDAESIVTDAHALPAIHIGDASADKLRAWLNSGSEHTATIGDFSIDYGQNNGDILASFSARGPSQFNIFAPDFIAPGVSIWGASHTTHPNDPPEYTLMSGTSAAAPYAAGAAALLTSLHPEWSPAHINAAIALTANTDNIRMEDGVTMAALFDRGSGRVNVSGAGNTGLTMDETYQHFLDANPALEGDATTLNLPYLLNNSCLETCVFTRVVSSTLSVTLFWEAHMEASQNLSVSISPASFTLAPFMTQTLVITVDASGLETDAWAFGEIVLKPPQYIYLPVMQRAYATGTSDPLQDEETAIRNGDAVPGPSPPDVHFPLAVKVPPPTIEIEPEIFNETLGSDVIVTYPLTITNLGGVGLDWAFFEDNIAGANHASAGGWADTFDSYAAGSDIIGQGGWKGWGNDANVGAIITDAVSLSAPNSVDVVGVTDIVREFSGYDGGRWVFDAHLFIPSSFSGQSYFILLNQYDDAGQTNNTSLQLRIDGNDGLIYSEFDQRTIPFATNAWSHLQIQIDLGDDTQRVYYDNVLLTRKSWSQGVSGGGIPVIGAVNLSGFGATSVFYDDLSLGPLRGACTTGPVDIPWAHIIPESGDTPPGGDSIVSIVYDTTELSPGPYVGTLCINSNDPETPLLPVSVILEVLAP